MEADTLAFLVNFDGAEPELLSLPDSSNIYDLKSAIEKVFHVAPEDQELLGFQLDVVENDVSIN